MTLSGAVSRQFLHLLDHIYEAACEPKAWEEFALAFERALGGAAVAIFFPHPRPGDDRPCRIVAPSCDPALVEAYPRDYASSNPFAAQLERLAVGSFSFGRRCVSEAALARSAFYAKWMKPQGFQLGPTLGGIIDRDGEEGTVAITVFRPRGAPACGRAELQLGRLLMPHLRRAIQLERRLQARVGLGAASAALDLLQPGLIFADARGHVRSANRSGEQILAGGDGLGVDRDGLHGASDRETEALKAMIAEAARPGAGGARPAGDVLSLPRPSGRRPLELLVAPLPERNRGFGGKRAQVAVFVTDPEERPEIPAARLSRLHGLTPAEAKLASALATGLCLAEAADLLGISRETARSRLKHIFAKTGTDRQAVLVQLLTRLPVRRPDSA